MPCVGESPIPSFPGKITTSFNTSIFELPVPKMYPSAVLLALFAVAAPSLAQEITSAPSLPVPTPTQECSLTEIMPSCGVRHQSIPSPRELTETKLTLSPKVPCISAAANSIGCTVPKDFACHCSHGPAMQEAVIPCVMSACGSDAPVVASVAQAICTACVATPTVVATAPAR